MHSVKYIWLYMQLVKTVIKKQQMYPYSFYGFYDQQAVKNLKKKLWFGNLIWVFANLQLT